MNQHEVKKVETSAEEMVRIQVKTQQNNINPKYNKKDVVMSTKIK